MEEQEHRHQQQRKQKPEEQKQKLEYGNSTIEYSVIRSKRVKTSEISVDDDKVIIRTPFGKPLPEIEKTIEEKASWILKKQLEHKGVIPEIIKPSFEDGSTLPYLGKNYRIKVSRGRGEEGEEKSYVKEDKIELVNEEFIIYLSNSEHSKRKIKTLYDRWLMQKAKMLFEDRIKHYSRELELHRQHHHQQPTQIIIKNQKSRWGSLTKGNVINLNVNVLKAPLDVIDYTVLHELCHLKIKEHSHSFWDYLNKFMPTYKDKVEWLKVNGASLISR
jgi:predicted metal-dependent hydrolase